MKPTIKDVAKQSSVSIATVSRVLHDLGGYSPETKRKVLQVIEEIGYKPNAIARGLVNRKTRTLGVLHPAVTGRFVVELLKGIEDYTHEHNYTVMICNTDNSGIRTMEYIRILGEKQVDGIIFASAIMTEEYDRALRRLNIPVVLISTISLSETMPVITVDNYKASYDATAYLIRKGHKDIVMLGGIPDNEVTGIPREQGFRQALADHGLRSDETSVYNGDFSFASAYEGMAVLRRNRPGATAVFSASDLMALGILHYAYRQNIKVPEELAVIGFDDTEDAMMSVPPLTTVRQPIERMGRMASQMILDPAMEFKTHILDHSITVRDSV